MKYNTLGKTDLKISRICLGTMTWGEQNTEDEAHAQIDYALEQGVNFMDAAELYPVPPKAETAGLTETYIGTWLKKHQQRDKWVIASKAASRSTEGLTYLRGGPRLNLKQLQKALDQSLKRLQTDYIDLYQMHWPERPTNFFGQLGYTVPAEKDETTPIEETLEALKTLQKSGKVRHFGLSNETAWGAMHWLHLARTKDLPEIVSVQNPYNLVNRSYEVGLAEVSHREKVGLLAYSPLAFGMLTGKYLGGQRPANARLTLFNRFTRYTSSPIAVKMIQSYVDLAQKHGLDPSQMALAFVNQQMFLDATIIGATNLKQLATNIDSINLDLSPEVLQGIQELHNSQPNPCP